MPKVVECLVKELQKLGVTHAFGIPGKPVVPIVLELDRQGIPFILSRHEAGGGYEAVGYALRSRKLGVAIGTSGCGGTNMLTSVAQAKGSNIPVLFLTGQPSIKQIGRGLGQDSTEFGTDLMKMFEPVTVFNARVERGDTFPSLFGHAIEKAFEGEGGPVHLNIPLEVLYEEIPDFEWNLPVFPKVVSANLTEVIDKIKQAKRSVLLLGENVHSSQVYNEIEQFATRFQIPVMTTTGGKGAFPTHHPLSLGSFGLGGTTESERYLEEQTDLMIVLGSKLNDMAIAGFKESWFPKEMIHFDYDSTFIGKSIPVPTLRVLGDVKANLQQILVQSEGYEKQEKVEIHLQPQIETFKPKENRLSVAQTMKTLRSVLPDESMVITDAGSHSFYAIKYFDVKKAGTFFMDSIIGPMGHAIGNAIGVKCREPKLPVVCVTGDGCMLMHGTEISTAVCNQIPVVFVVINNGQLDMVEKGMSNFHDRVVGVVYNQPLNVSQFAQSMGAEAFRCHNEQELERALEQALLNQMPTVVEVMVDPTEIPPTLKRG